MTEPVPAGRRTLIAPDCFGDSLTATAAADAIAGGWRRARPRDTLVLAPQSDGGPGFVEALTTGHPDMHLRRTRVSGPLADDVDATWVWNPTTSTAYIESAQACGLHLLGGPPTADTAWCAHSRGVGELVAQALRCGAATIVVGLGGSGCTDGGRGMVDALGGPGEAARALAEVHLVAATDVEHPLLGRTGAAAVFGPQKGADPATVARLESRLAQWAAELEAATGRVVSGCPGAGAAGGLGAALLAFGTGRQSGAGLIAVHTGIAEEIARADLLVTGEGRLDEQSLHGKVVGALAAMASQQGVPVLVLAGQVTLAPAALVTAGITAAHSLADHAGSVRRAIDDAAAQLADLAFRVAGALRKE
jgi:glycerate kinase